MKKSKSVCAKGFLLSESGCRFIGDGLRIFMPTILLFCRAPILFYSIWPGGWGCVRLALAVRHQTPVSGGEYTIRVEQLPNDASDQRQQLIRRLAAHDSGVDIMILVATLSADKMEKI